MFRIQFQTRTIIRILHVLTSCKNAHTRQRVFQKATQQYIRNSACKVHAIRRLNGTATHHSGLKHTRIRPHHHRFNHVKQTSDWGVYGILDFNKRLFGIQDVMSMFESGETHYGGCKFIHCRLSLEPCHIHIHTPASEFESHPYFLVEGARVYHQFVCSAPSLNIIRSCQTKSIRAVLAHPLVVQRCSCTLRTAPEPVSHTGGHRRCAPAFSIQTNTQANTACIRVCTYRADIIDHPRFHKASAYEPELHRNRKLCGARRSANVRYTHRSVCEQQWDASHRRNLHAVASSLGRTHSSPIRVCAAHRCAR